MFGRLITFLGWLITAGTTVVLITILVLSGAAAPDIPRVPERLDRLISVPPTQIFAADGSLLTQVGGRNVVPLDRISESFQRAVLAAEDDQFYTHPGIDKPALIKATIYTAIGNRSRGGSTITQQLAKNLFFTFRKSTTRKFREILVAFEIEDRFSKDDILAAYCNGIPFGGGAYGVEDAAQHYFSDHAANLSLGQASLLAGLPQSPGRYNPYYHLDRAQARQQWILSRIRNFGWINDREMQQAMQEPLVFREIYASADEGRYFIDAILNDVENRYDANVVYHGGLKIYTTLNPITQGQAIEAVRVSLEDLDERFELEPFTSASQADRSGYPQGTLVAMEVATGAVVALVGGRDYDASQFNRALTRIRNMGSSLKPTLYLTAIEQLDYTPATVVLDSQITIEIPGSTPWSPPNFDLSYRGPLILKRALASSLNSVAARLILNTTPDAMVNTIHRFGIDAEIEPNYSLALGAAPITSVEMAGIISSIANQGEVVRPYMITRIEDATGTILEEHLIRRESQFDREDVFMLIDMMQAVVEYGTGHTVSRYGFNLPAIGKTGTTNDYVDSWFIGATPRLAAVAWVGFDDNRSMRTPDNVGITGASGALPIWARFMVRATEGEPVRDFPVPPGIEYRYVRVIDGAPMDSPGSGILRVAIPAGRELVATAIDSSWFTMPADTSVSDTPAVQDSLSLNDTLILGEGPL